MKRILLFLATNFAILIVLGIALSILMPLLGIDSQSNAGLLLFSAVFGIGGSFFSLAMWKWIAKNSVGARVIEQPANQQELWLVDTVKRAMAALLMSHPPLERRIAALQAKL